LTPNSRSYLNRWSQPDSIIPDGNPQSLNRFAYAENNPIRYNDPTGHCPICLLAVAATIIAIVLTETAKPVGDNASNIWELMHLGVEHADHANITGAGLQSLENDQSVQSAEDKLVADIRSNPNYGKQAFSIDSGNKMFTAGDINGSWVLGALTGNPSFYMVHTAILYDTNTRVSANGTISTTWEVRDNFDYIPAWGDHTTRPNLLNYLAYNIGATLVSPIYYGLLGAKPQIPTTANWDQTIYRPVTNSKKLIPQ
jgi:hypothetical protein